MPPSPAPDSTCRVSCVPRSFRLALKARNPSSLQASRHLDVKVFASEEGDAPRSVDLRQEGAWAGVIPTYAIVPRAPRPSSAPPALIGCFSETDFFVSLLTHSFVAGLVDVVVVFVHSSTGTVWRMRDAAVVGRRFKIYLLALKILRLTELSFLPPFRWFRCSAPRVSSLWVLGSANCSPE